MSDKLAIFDLCDTLVAENTTLGFLTMLGRSHPQIARTVRRWTDRRNPLFYAGAVAHRCGIDIARARLIRHLRGFDRKSLNEAADLYAQSVLYRAKNVEVSARLAALRDSGARVVIVSTSLDIVVKAVADVLGVEGRGSRLGWSDDQCTGRIECDLTGRKVSILREVAPHGWSTLVAYSDNELDLPLLELADHGVLVIPKGRQIKNGRAGAVDVLAL